VTDPELRYWISRAEESLTEPILPKPSATMSWWRWLRRMAERPGSFWR
jgi:hypothetical protein